VGVGSLLRAATVDVLVSTALCGDSVTDEVVVACAGALENTLINSSTICAVSHGLQIVICYVHLHTLPRC